MVSTHGHTVTASRQSTHAQTLVQRMAALGVRRIYSLSGNQIMPIYDACLDAGIEIVHTRHEGAAVFMADAAARITGEPAVALVTAGPGFGNALGALFAVQQVGSPVVLLSGDSEAGAQAIGAFQRLDQCAAASPFAKRSERASLLRTPAALFEQAWRESRSGTHGPIHIALPADVLVAPVTRENAEDSAAQTRTVEFRPAPASSVVDDRFATLRTRLEASSRPLVLAAPALGFGANADLLNQFSDEFDVPVHVAVSPRGLRDPAGGTLATVIGKADFVLTLGLAPNFSVGRLQPVRGDIVAVHADLAVLDEFALTLPTHSVAPLHADPLTVLTRLCGRTKPGIRPSRASWRTEFGEALAHRELVGTCPAFVAGLRAASDWLAQRSRPVLVVDGGEFGQWAQAYVRATERLINGPSGCIGGGLPMAIAASVERRDATVVLFTGDGSIGFHLGELDTAVRAGARPIVVIGNDSSWNAERQIQIRDYGEDRQIACDLNPDARYEQVAQAFGGYGERLADAAELPAALDRAWASERAAVIDWRIVGAPAPNYT